MRLTVCRCSVGVFACALAFGAQSSFPDGPGKELVEVICTSCHTPDRILEQKLTRAEWKDKVLEMLQEEPDVTEAERQRIVDYLARSFPKKVNVNKAGAAEIEAVLEIPAQDASAIVRWRESKGSFRTLDDLKRVPGLDAARIESNKQRVEF
jgi:competence protein ComEA